MAKKKAPRGYMRGKWSKQALKVLSERYLAKDSLGRVIETPEGMCYRVAKKIALVEKKFPNSSQKPESLTKDFYQIMVKRYFLPNSPTLMNAGRDDELQYSACFVLPVEDSIDGIFDAIKNSALIHKSGGGTGFAFSRLRPKGSIVNSTRGVASGPVSFMRVFDAATAEIKQGGMRRGANMGILRVDHPDILEFIDCKAKGGITNFNISVAITDSFMKAVEKKTNYWLVDPRSKKKVRKLKAGKVFQEIVKMAWQTGDPGLIFLDRVNSGHANPVPFLGPIESTNPCVVGTTLIATEKGLVKIGDLVGKKKEIKILNDDRVIGKKGLKLRSCRRFWDNGVKKVWRLKTKSGFELMATADHKIMTTHGWVPLAKLKIGEDKVLIQAGKGVFNSDKKLPFEPQNVFKGRNGRKYSFNFPKIWSKELGQVLGWLVGDGWLRSGDKNCRVGFSFGKESQPALDYLKPVLNGWHGQEIKAIQRENQVWHLSYHSQYFVDFFKKLGVKAVKAQEKEVPEALFTAPEEAVVGFLQGLFSADGTVRNSRKITSDWVALTSKSEKLLQGAQILLLNLGIKSRIFNRSRKPRKGMFPYQAKDGRWRSYTTDGILYELGIFGDFRERFRKKVGFILDKKQQSLKNLRLRQRRSFQDSYLDQLVLIEACGKKNVYDLTVPVSHSMVANGLVVHQCGEQPLYPNEACNLGSINLSLMVKKKSFKGRSGSGRKKEVDWEKLARVTRLATRFLDNVVEINPFPLAEIVEMVQANRRIGLGVMGWADLLFQLEIPYDSKQAIALAEKVMKFIQKNAHQESQLLAKKRGSFPNFKKSIYKDGPPLRNATLTTIAPTGSISIIGGCSSGIEPIFALVFKHKTSGRELNFFNPFFLAAAKKHKLPAELAEKVKLQGNLENLKLPRKLKKVFVTAHEVDWEGHIETQAAFQKGIDNAVSKTINFPHEATKKEIKKAYLYAYQKGCLGITVYRDRCREEQVLYAGEKKEEKIRKEIKIKPRPAVASGKTYRIDTPVGTAYITVNINGNDEPLEVFVGVGKAGSDIQADAEAIGRLISLNLRLGTGLPAQEVLAKIIDQLDGIGGGGSVGFGKNKIRSLADAVAKVLREHQGGKRVAESQISQQQGLLKKITHRDLCPACGLASLIFEEGCAKCHYCGYNKC